MSDTSPTLRGNSLVRLLSLVARLGIGTVSAIVTARVLGPSAKGALSTLLYVGTLLAYACSLGLGDAAAVLVGRGRADLQRSISASIPAALLASVAGGGALLLVAHVAHWTSIAPAVALGLVLLPIATMEWLLSGFVDALEDLTFTAITAVVAVLVATAVTILLVGLGLGVAGGVLGSMAGSSAGVALLVVGLRRRGLSSRPRVDRGYLATALRFGLVVETTHLLDALAERADLLLVYALASEPDAGIYTVALTLGRLSAYAAYAIATATFPRLATVSAADARRLIPQSARLAGLTALLSAGLLAVVLPVAIPILFGRDYDGAVLPSIVLAASGIAYGPQLALARAAAARGESGIYFRSFSVSLVVMLVGDVIAIPDHRSLGAAVAALASSCAGLVHVVLALRRRNLVALRDLVPRAEDVRLLVTFAGRLANVRQSAGQDDSL